MESVSRLLDCRSDCDDRRRRGHGHRPAADPLSACAGPGSSGHRARLFGCGQAGGRSHADLAPPGGVAHPGHHAARRRAGRRSRGHLLSAHGARPGPHVLALSRSGHHDRTLFRWHIYRHFRPADARSGRASTIPGWLAVTMFPWGRKSDFRPPEPVRSARCRSSGSPPSMFRASSAPISPFGLCLSLIGGGMHLSQGGVDAALLTNLIIGGVFGALARNRPCAAHPSARHAPCPLPLALRPGHATLLAGPGQNRQLIRPSPFPLSSTEVQRSLPRSIPTKTRCPMSRLCDDWKPRT